MRYSLLTLLLVTAAIAVGVKWWRGPHHVVERPAADLEREYAYCRDWRGTKIIDGVEVHRHFDSEHRPTMTEITLFRRGVYFGCYTLSLSPENDKRLMGEGEGIQGFRFTKSETELLRETVRREQEPFRAAGIHLPERPVPQSDGPAMTF